MAVRTSGLLLLGLALAGPVPAQDTASAPSRPAASAPVAAASAPASGASAAVSAERLPERVWIDSLDAGVRVPGYWYPAPRPNGAAVIGLHGCGGLGARNGRLGSAQRRYAQLLNDAGIGILFTESFEPRGERSLCSQKPAERHITEANRRLDVYAALTWLAARPGLDARRLGVIGWSHGGQTVLASADRSEPVVARANPRPAALVAFYPGCTVTERQAGFEPVAPLLVMSGARDDWTSPAPCRRLVQRLAGRADGVAVRFIEFADSYHGFDSALPPRELTNIGGTSSGRATVGGNPAAREASAAALLAFLATHLRP